MIAWWWLPIALIVGVQIGVFVIAMLQMNREAPVAPDEFDDQWLDETECIR